MSELQLELDLEYAEEPTPLFPEVTAHVLNDIWTERIRQDDKWGLQDHPYFSGPPNPEAGRRFYALQAGYLKDDNNRYVSTNELGWDTIAFEELYEALEKAAVDDEAYERELIETAAVLVAMVEANRRKRGVVA